MSVEVSKAGITPVGNLIDYLLDNYQTFKGVLNKNETLGPHVGPIVNFGEETTKSLIEKSPVNVKDFVAKVDSHMDAACSYGGNGVAAINQVPNKIKTGACELVMNKLSKMKLNPDEVKAEPNFTDVANNLKEITSERLSQLLDASEGYLYQYFPLSEDDAAKMKVNVGRGEFKPILSRTYLQGKVTASKLKETTLAKLGNLKKRTSEVVHIDLVKYSEYLDQHKETLKDIVSTSYDSFDQKVVNNIKTISQNTSQNIRSRVIDPVYQSMNSVQIHFKDYLILIHTTVVTEYECIVVRPRDQIIQIFKEELANQREIFEKHKNDPNDPPDILAGVKAVIFAFKTRVASRINVQLSPYLSNFLKL